MKKVYGTSETSGAPLSAAWEVGDAVFISGQIHADEHWNLIGDTVEERFAAIMQRVEQICADADLTTQDIVHVRMYLTDLTELSALNDAYTAYFEHPLPARTALGVAALPLGASLEIEAVAAR